jgi:hypothetical protein
MAKTIENACDPLWQENHQAEILALHELQEYLASLQYMLTYYNYIDMI